MKLKTCTLCGSKMIRNGYTKAGRQRWRCVSCGSSSTHTNDVSSRDLKAFLGWLLSKDRQVDMPGQGRSFRRRIEPIWKIWPVAQEVDEIHRVIYVDGIYLTRDVVILIARSDDYILSWYLSRSENAYSYKQLLSRIAPPVMVVSDGGQGFLKAVKKIWPHTLVQRCLFHVFCHVKRYTTSHPRLLAGKELYSLAKDLLSIKTLKQAYLWTEKYFQWCDFWDDFLSEKTYTPHGYEYSHIRLRKARKSLATLISKGMLFTYLKPELAYLGKLPSTNNLIEGATNAKIREMLKNHRGLSLVRRIKACFWFCYMNTECPKSLPEILKTMPTDDDQEILRGYFASIRITDAPDKWGTGIVWEELHHKTRYPFSTD